MLNRNRSQFFEGVLLFFHSTFFYFLGCSKKVLLHRHLGKEKRAQDQDLKQPKKNRMIWRPFAFEQGYDTLILERS